MRPQAVIWRLKARLSVRTPKPGSQRSAFARRYPRRRPYNLQAKISEAAYVSMEAEIPEVLYRMKDFIGEHPNWDQYQLMSSALAHFLFQNGCDDRAVTERYLDDLFSR